VRARGNIGKDTRDATGLSPWCFADAGLKSSAYIAASRGGSAGRHPCSTAWRDVRGLRPAVLLFGSDATEAENLGMPYNGAPVNSLSNVCDGGCCAETLRPRRRLPAPTKVRA
jgi:hypothetical protein